MQAFSDMPNGQGEHGPHPSSPSREITQGPFRWANIEDQQQDDVNDIAKGNQLDDPNQSQPATDEQSKKVVKSSVKVVPCPIDGCNGRDGSVSILLRKLKTHKKYVCSACWLLFDTKDHKCNEQYCVVATCSKVPSEEVRHKHGISCAGRGEARKQGELTYLCGLLGVAPLVLQDGVEKKHEGQRRGSTKRSIKRDSSHVENEETLRSRELERALEKTSQHNDELLCMLRHVREDMERAGLPLSHALLSRYKRHAPSALNGASQTPPQSYALESRDGSNTDSQNLQPNMPIGAGSHANEDFPVNNATFQASNGSTQRDSLPTLQPLTSSHITDTWSPVFFAALNDRTPEDTLDPQESLVHSFCSQDIVGMGSEPQSLQLETVPQPANQTSIGWQQPSEQHWNTALSFEDLEEGQNLLLQDFVNSMTRKTCSAPIVEYPAYWKNIKSENSNLVDVDRPRMSKEDASCKHSGSDLSNQFGNLSLQERPAEASRGKPSNEANLPENRD